MVVEGTPCAREREKEKKKVTSVNAKLKFRLSRMKTDRQATDLLARRAHNAKFEFFYFFLQARQ